MRTAKLLAAVLLLPLVAAAQQRPHITGIDHVAFFVSDLPKALLFWHDLLGYEVVGKPNPTKATLQINDHERIEISTETPITPRNQFDHLCLIVDDIDQMRAYLKAQGIASKPAGIALQVIDPDGTRIEFIQPRPSPTPAKLSPNRISDAIYHVGFIVGNTAKSIDFYSRIFGFRETWRGTPPAKQDLSWINLQVPDGADYIELMLYRAPATPDTWGSSNHVALSVPDIHASLTKLKASAAVKGYTRPMEIRTGVNQKRQLNLFDPDGTRVELMEPVTITGKPTPSSTAPPPPPALD
ncbi:VOC family protein [Terriglobus saanensis]|uniref:Glyoxalase/bleomycin resistance protein/dioxygenase n=1 Tax=Terriglobus saanensis (strain ATCC BAA-1853 / DSM 23119 / SP1PR4) TaxID=401053 RepID=E8V231_TERSS|nr:VOC family protein [Terriglobus saanensis]ADV84588.1 Glyoxalase/bleomycin resistance protein/dioxygenase [Terriglobus saanensis SP1PR4]